MPHITPDPSMERALGWTGRAFQFQSAKTLTNACLVVPNGNRPAVKCSALSMLESIAAVVSQQGY